MVQNDVSQVAPPTKALRGKCRGNLGPWISWTWHKYGALLPWSRSQRAQLLGAKVGPAGLEPAAEGL